MLSDNERIALQRHARLIEEYEAEIERIIEKATEPHRAKLEEHFFWAYPEMKGGGKVPARSLLHSAGQWPTKRPEISQLGRNIWDRIGAATAAKPDLNPWNTPPRLAKKVSDQLYAVDYFQNDCPYADAKRIAIEKAAESYRESYDLSQAFLPLAPSVLYDLPYRENDPVAGLNQIRRWCEYAMMPITSESASDVPRDDNKHGNTQEEDLPAGNWLMPPMSLQEFGTRLGKPLSAERLHVLLDKYGLRNFPPDNRQSWTVCLDPPMPESLRNELKPPPPKK